MASHPTLQPPILHHPTLNAPRVHVVDLPAHLTPADLAGHAVAVFDVLRATTTITQAIAAGCTAIHLFDSPAAARAAAAANTTAKAAPSLLAGEIHCLPAPGFDLGNSPSHFTPAKVAGQTIHFATTNGTRALLAASTAPVVIAACLNNAQAAAEYLHNTGLPVTLLAAGTNGQPADEDLAGCGAVAHYLQQRGYTPTPSALAAIALFHHHQHDLISLLRSTPGGQNILQANLPNDITFAAQLNTTTAIARLSPPNILDRA
jgi:2-phosphosulfolactate phosphatase